MANPVTYADLDTLLASKGFVRRILPDDHVAYVDQAEEPIFVFPDLPMDQAVQAVHLATVRRWLIELGLSEPEEFERWLCQIRFGVHQPEVAVTSMVRTWVSSATFTDKP